MAMDEAPQEAGPASRIAGVLVSLPVDIAITALGAGVLVARELTRLAEGLWSPPGPQASPRHHDASKVREHAAAAMQAARASGLLAKRKR